MQYLRYLGGKSLMRLIVCLLGCTCMVFQISCGTETCSATCIPGQRKCDAAKNQILICALASGSQCAAWGIIPCQANEICQDNNGQVSCGGTSSCPGACTKGSTRCQGNATQICEQTPPATCPDWGQTTPCAAGQQCTAGVCGTPPACQDGCSEGDVKCAGNATQSCVRGSDGCLAWGAETACAAGEICQQGQCSSDCKNLCNVNETRCSNQEIQTCVTDPASQCPLWGKATPCPGGQQCQAGKCMADPCNNPCKAGEVRCQGNAVQTCAKGQSGCLEWGAPVACAAAQLCKVGKCEGGGCKDVCKAGAKRCQGNGTQTCAKGADGCTAWSKTQACPAGQACANGQCKAGCTNACTAGAKRCAGNKLQTCVKGGNGCTAWNGGTACPNGDVCDTGKCVKPGDPSQRTQQAVCARWKKDYPITTQHGFTNAANNQCDPGKIKAGALNDAIRRLSLYRWLVGLPATANDTSLTQQAQSCAIILSANRKNSHNPPKTWLCWNATGAAAAGKSNVFVGPSHPAISISGFIDDNYAGSRLGHRHWCLHPGLGTTGIGFAVHPTSRRPGTCHYVTHASRSSQSKIDYIAYPPAGFVPMQAMRGAYQTVADWSFVSTKYNVSGVKTVTMIRKSDNDTQSVAAKTTAGGGYRLPTGITWRPRYPKAGETYTVKLGTVFSYTVKFFDCK